MLGKIPISEDTNDIADDGTPLILQEKNTPTKTEIEKLISVIAEKLPPIVDEITCVVTKAKVFEELSVMENISVNNLVESTNSNLPRDIKN